MVTEEAGVGCAVEVADAEVEYAGGSRLEQHVDRERLVLEDVRHLRGVRNDCFDHVRFVLELEVGQDGAEYNFQQLDHLSRDVFVVLNEDVLALALLCTSLDEGR